MTDAITARKEREASIKKSEFLAIMAHEIRTPLHQVTGFIDLLDQTDLNKEQRSFVKLLKSSAQGLMTVINDVLDYSKLEAGKMKIETIPYEPLSVLEGCLSAVRASCEEKNLYLTMDWNKKIPFKLLGDPNRLRQVLLNILSNAVKFTSNGGIHVQAHLTSLDPTTTTTAPEETEYPSMIKFIVTDTGMGISKKHQGVIFNQYQQGSVSVARNFGGTGLGLSICKLLIGTMGGAIGLESEPGHGTSFWFTLPLQIPKDDGDDHVEESLDASNRVEGGLHILVAEDNKVNQKLLGSMLKRMGHTWDFAENGKVALERVEKTTYDVVLMDIQMPVMDGLEATRRIRSLGYADLPILGLTASVSRSDFTELGFNDWLPKPIPMKELTNRLYRIKYKHRPGLSGVAESE
jgi:CheY-like chemotaxis protein/nitrogen-specific signal transduction histidine kinase